MKGITLAAIVLLIGRVAAAQTPPPTLEGLVREVNVDEKLLVTTADGAQVSGRLRSLTVESVELDTVKGRETIPSARIGRIVVKDPVSDGLGIGLAAGAGAGLAGGMALNAICVNESGACLGI